MELELFKNEIWFHNFHEFLTFHVKRREYKLEFFRKVYTMDRMSETTEIDEFFFNIPEHYYQSKDFCMEVFNKSNLIFIPEQKRTYDLCLEAVKKDSYDLAIVPDKYKTEELCLIAVKNSHLNFRFVPEDIKEKVIEAWKRK